MAWLEGSLWAVGATLLLWGILAFVLQQMVKRREGNAAAEEGDRRSTALRLRERIAQGRLTVNTALTAVVATPLVFCMGHIAFVHIRSRSLTAGGIAVAVISGAILWGWACLRWRRARRDLRLRWWIYDAKAMVAKHVLDLKARGYVVFSDCQIDETAFDHILVGPKGVFTVQTFVGAAAYLADLNAYGTVAYDGRTLFFPDEENHESIEQASAEAETLSEWLSRALEAPLAARAIVALPGWQIKRTSAEGISVINPSQFEALFQYVRPRPLSEEMILQLTDQVRQHCAEEAEPFNTPTPSGEIADMR